MYAPFRRKDVFLSSRRTSPFFVPAMLPCVAVDVLSRCDSREYWTRRLPQIRSPPCGVGVFTSYGLRVLPSVSPGVVLFMVPSVDAFAVRFSAAYRSARAMKGVTFPPCLALPPSVFFTPNSVLDLSFGGLTSSVNEEPVISVLI